MRHLHHFAIQGLLTFRLYINCCKFTTNATTLEHMISQTLPHYRVASVAFTTLAHLEVDCWASEVMVPSGISGEISDEFRLLPPDNLLGSKNDK